LAFCLVNTYVLALLQRYFIGQADELSSAGRMRLEALECNANAFDVLKLNRVQVQQFHWKFKFVRQKRTIAEIFETWQPYLLQKQRRCKNT